MKSRRRYTKGLWGLILGVTLLLVPGCWNQLPVNELAIAVALAVSADHQWTFLFTNATVTASSLTSMSSSEQFYPITVRAASYQAALDRVQRQSPRAVGVGDLETLIISARLTTEQVTSIMHDVTLNGAVPIKLWLVASQNSPTSLLLHSTPETVLPVYGISSYFSCHGCHAANLGVRGWQWWVRRVTPGISPVIPMVTATPTGLAVREMLVYPAQGKPLTMPRRVTDGFSYLTGKVTKSVLPLQVGHQRYLIASVRDHASSHVQLTPTAVHVHVVIHAIGDLVGAPPGQMITSATEQAVDRAASRAILSQSLLTIDWANRTRTDPFGYAERGAWLRNTVATAIPPSALAGLPIHAQVRVSMQIQGEGVSR